MNIVTKRIQIMHPYVIVRMLYLPRIRVHKLCHNADCELEIANCQGQCSVSNGWSYKFIVEDTINYTVVSLTLIFY